MVYSRQKRLLFVHVSRTGGTAITNFLHGLLPDAESVLGQHDPLAAARPLLGKDFERSFKFAFVRNPWDRFVSWYALVGRATHRAETDQAAVVDPGSWHWKGFDSFLESWCAEKVLIDGARRGRLSQWFQLTDAHGALLTDGYGRFETFAEDAARLLAEVGIDCPRLPTVSPSRHHHYSVYYSDFGRELIENAFAEDVKEFGYRFEDSVAEGRLKNNFGK